MIDERDMPGEQPPRHVLVLLADQILDDIRLEASDAVTLRNRIVGALMYVRHEATRAWLGSALTRARGDD